MIKNLNTQIEYSKHGYPIIRKSHGAQLNAQKNGKTFTIQANSKGLLLLAQGLIALATYDESSEPDFHIHLDDLYEINDEGVDFILSKKINK